MSTVLLIATALLSIHVANSYILLTANLEDFQAIAKQIATSPVGVQINQIIRRASSLFKEGANASVPAAPAPVEPQKRTDSNKDNELQGHSYEVWKPDAVDEVQRQYKRLILFDQQ